METVDIERGYDGCGLCFLGLVRLSRKTDKTNSPSEQREKVLRAVAAVGGHVIDWAEDLEVSGATDPLTRPALGPWLRGEKGEYDGLAGAAVDRIGRNQLDVLNTADRNHKAGKKLLTYGHMGLWDLDDPADEMRLSMEAFGAQVELRAIQRRNREETDRARKAGQVKQPPSYGYMFVRRGPNLPIDHIAIDPEAAEVIRGVAQRLLTDTTGTITCATEAARLTRERVLSPSDRRAVLYGKEPQGRQWSATSLRGILTSEAALGYLIHKGRAVLGDDGHPRRIAEGLWNQAMRDALIEKTKPKVPGAKRARKGVNLLSGVSYCGGCNEPLYRTGHVYACVGRSRNVLASQDCQPSPSMKTEALDARVTEWFLSRYGSGQIMRKVWDPGTGHATRIKEIEADRKRLRDDRNAGLYDDPADQEWYREAYKRMTREIAELAALPDRPAAMRMMPTGQTVAQKWQSALDDAARREMLNEYQVRVTLYSRQTTENRVRITGMTLPVAEPPILAA